MDFDCTILLKPANARTPLLNVELHIQNSHISCRKWSLESFPSYSITQRVDLPIHTPESLLESPRVRTLIPRLKS